ncbi:MAG: class I SAM-dependent methyltransferase [Bdellovibrionales bacterium]|jgi:SAM-dependent methyltransferase
MTMDVVDLREFYISPLGRLTSLLLRRRLASLWPSVKGETVAALGYGTPLLRPWLGQAKALLAVMPDSQGVAFWPREGPNVACLASLTQLPLEDESVSRVFLLHALELAPDPAAVMQEAWRILKPNGQIVIIVPNRRGLWALSDQTPFGVGQPYSASQLRCLVREHFFLEKIGHALFMPPCSSRLSMLAAPWMERAASALLLGGGGVLVAHASKQVYAPAMTKCNVTKRRFVLPLPFPPAPVPTGRNTLKTTHLAF